MTLKFAANLTWLFQEWDFLDRFAAAADAGFKYVEYLFPYDHDPDAIAAKLARHDLKQVLFNLPPGDWAKGERGLAALPERKADFRAAVAMALTYARATGTMRMHLMSGVASGDAALAAYKDSLAYACEAAAKEGRQIMIEPLNPYDAPGFFMNSFDLAGRVIADLKLPNLKLQFDIYHRQVIHGNVIRGLEQFMPITGHMQISGAPYRREPLTGELDDRFILSEVERLGYDGYIGAEYGPVNGTLAGLGWMKELMK